MHSLMDAVKLRAAATYNAAADSVDEVPLAFWDRIGQRTVERLDLADGDSVLDVGCGTGSSALPAAERVGPLGEVVGVDLAEAALARARAKAACRGLDNVLFRVGDMERLGFPDRRFDAVICVFAIFFVADMQRQVADLWRLVKPGGQLAITTWGQDLFEPAATAWWQAVQRERPDLCLPVQPWGRITNAEAVQQLMLDAGMPVVEVVAENRRQVLRTPEDWWTIVLGSGYRGTVEQLGPEAAARVREASIAWVRDNAITGVETNAIYAVATKPPARGPQVVRFSTYAKKQLTGLRGLGSPPC